MSYVKPLPDITEENRPFWDALKEHVFLVPRCTECGDYNWVPAATCRSCFNRSLRWTEVSGRGSLYSYTVVRRGPGAWQEDVPYVVAMVELEENPRPLIVMGNLVDGEVDLLEIGMPVEITYLDIPEEDVTLWQFTLRQATP